MYICVYVYICTKSFELCTNSSAQSSFIPNFLVDFCVKIHRDHTVLARSKNFIFRFCIHDMYDIYIYTYILTYIYI